MSPSKPLKVFIHTLDAVGHIAACNGLGQVFVERGHQVYFLLNSQFRDRYDCDKFGFGEILLEKANQPAPGEAPEETDEAAKAARTKARAQKILDLGILNPKPPLEKVKNDVKDDSFVQSLYETVKELNPQIAAAIGREQPDLFILDHFLVPPAVLQAGIPWFYLHSSNPLGMYKSPQLPPNTSGYSVDSDPKLWEEFHKYNDIFRVYFAKYQVKLFEDFNYKYTEEEAVKKPVSKYGTIYGYPSELDYHDVIPIDESKKYIRVDSFSRKTADPFELPAEFARKKLGEKLIYFSLGSVGSVDLKLMKKVTDALAKTPYKCIVSKGMLAAEYELPENCWGQEFLPQIQILPLVDLVITHGGNNTVTEAFVQGKPMIVMPLFADQPDNAQRVHEKGYGIRLNPYEFEESELLDAVHRLLNDAELEEKLKVVAARVESENSKARAVERIEQLVEQFKASKF